MSITLRGMAKFKREKSISDPEPKDSQGGLDGPKMMPYVYHRLVGPFERTPLIFTP